MYVDLTDLPNSIVKALAFVEYNVKNINVETREKISMIGAGGAGRREFVLMVNIETGEKELHLGSWGGANPFNQDNPVDLDRSERNMIPGLAVIKGSQGGKTFATLYLHPDNFVKLLPPKPEVTDREKKILNCMGFKSGYRKEYLERMKATQEEIESLVTRGFLTKSGRGLTLTTSGKNARGNGF